MKENYYSLRAVIERRKNLLTGGPCPELYPDKQIKAEKEKHDFWKLESKAKKVVEKSRETECPHCKFLDSIFKPISEMPDRTNREYWIFTEMFVYLHDGKDYCNWHKE